MTMNRADAADCAPVSDRHDHEAVAAVFRALGEPARLQIVHSLASGEQRVVDLVGAVGLAQSTTSAHLAVLREAGLVAPRVEGRSTYYSLTTTALVALVHRAEELLEDGLHAVVHSHAEGVG
ncbi:transcriptional regulator, ArsR family [Beutenbergia cavernae DSM 12333]|uniref:Transcriptional regulator, ArsR family n=1 Tax=Beutenbergia cavernae (strain ATCC BAA-8 / DSM 12333 / CCUG 43141 / JCM 11478 / NBRC 16432 / NCIMB 13614 / HKI 0122) TaxID=471853 RepID=C5C2B4_BEUC1|nr:metalloregulator ArsR/SmtB family transcription factor [Beutenbergia cavernae]ACQ81739.1 transcriptional regulator, ArsR family [Beutenbergia cavernae DSM 12333]